MQKRSQAEGPDSLIKLAPSPIQKRIYKCLDDLDLSAVEAARKVGAPDNLIRDALRLGQARTPTPENLLSIARTLGTTSDWLINGDSITHQMTADELMINKKLQAKVRQVAVQSLETAGLELEPRPFSELMMVLYKRLSKDSKSS
ncbi:hypothetical protein V6575_15980 [Roseibium sp. H3510]|uniref:HTH cro/C1-type domain-containing protein n=2 Tax=Roseibium algae TaxID=3123038 RepID=A0ABU8TPF8_9HYPH